MVRIDANGSKIWDKTLIAPGGSHPKDLITTNDGNYLITGHAWGADAGGDRSQPSYGNSDFWTVKMDDDGNKIWDRNYGGSGADYGQSVISIDDESYVFSGYSWSNVSFDKSENVRGNYDYWIVKTDANGNRNHHATDPDGDDLTWAISGGADAAKFSINAATGELSFVGGNYEDPQDSDQDNTYEVTLRASDPSGLYADQTLRISVTDANDSPTNTGPVALNNSNFQTAVDLWFANQSEAISTYGYISDWNTSAVTDMSNAFKDRANFNEDISGWNVSSVTNFGGMFRDAASFNQGLGDWDTSSANSMHQMFTG